jgi:hypothetical protein
MIMVRFRRGFITGAAIAEIVPVENAGLLEQPHGAIDGRDRNARIELDRAFVQLLHVGMVTAFRQHARDNAALVGDAQAAFGAKRLDIDCLMHDCSGVRKRPLRSF